MVIRKANEGDLETLLELRLLYLKEAFDKNSYKNSYDEETTAATIKDYFKRQINGDVFTAYLAEADGEVAAVIFEIRVEKPASPCFLSGKTAMLMNVYTKENYRRQGIAEALLKTVIADAKAAGISCIDLTATDVGRPLYEKHGFAPLKYSSFEMRLQIHD